MKLSKEQVELIKTGLWRFARTFIPQVPALCAYLVGIKPEWGAVLSFAGACVTALDKMLRDLKVY